MSTDDNRQRPAPDWRGLCEELAEALDGWHKAVFETGVGWVRPDETYLIDRARAALAAEADGPDVPEGREPASVVGEPSDEELLDIAAQAIDGYSSGIKLGEYEAENEIAVEAYGSELITFARAVLSRFGHQPAPPAAGEVGELVEFLRIYGDEVMDEYGDVGEHDQLTRAADLLEQRHPAPPAAGEVAELVALLRYEAREADLDLMTAEQCHRAADLLEQRHPTPVPVSERLRQLEDLAADAVSGLRYIEQTHGRLYGVGWDRVYEKADRLQPAHALPLPAGEVQA